jgi:acyl carrier protein
MVLTTAWRIRRHIKNDILSGNATSNDPLAARELDSLQVEQLVAYLEDTFDLRFDDDELVMESFASVPTLARLVERKRKAKVGAG